MSMVSMKVQKPQLPDAAAGAVASEEPDFPYGTKINLEEPQLEALGLNDLPKAGEQFMIRARVVVSGTGVNPSEKTGQGRSLSLQITDLELQDDKEKSDEAIGKKVYDKSYTVPVKSTK